MKANEFKVRPSSGFDTAFSVYWQYDINRAKEIYSGTKEECDKRLKLIQETIVKIEDKVNKEFTIEKFNELIDESTREDALLRIKIGALMFEFVSRDYDDNEGAETNVECYILGKGSYGITEENRDGINGISYDNVYCTHWFHDEWGNDFNGVKEFILNEILKFVVCWWDNEINEMVQYANAELSWEGIEGGYKRQTKEILLKLHAAGGCDGSTEYDKGWDNAITEAITIVEEVTGVKLIDILENE